MWIAYEIVMRYRIIRYKHYNKVLMEKEKDCCCDDCYEDTVCMYCGDAISKLARHLSVYEDEIFLVNKVKNAREYKRPRA